MKKCLECKKEFYRIYRKSQKFCSIECAANWHSKYKWVDGKRRINKCERRRRRGKSYEVVSDSNIDLTPLEVSNRRLRKNGAIKNSMNVNKFDFDFISAAMERSKVPGRVAINVYRKNTMRRGSIIRPYRG